MFQFKVAAAAFALACATSALEAGERRQAAAHEHGRGNLDVAIDGQLAGFEMRIPGADIVGFEHAASSDEDKAKLAAAKEILGEPGKIVTLPEAAGCVAEPSFVHYTKDPEHAAHHEKEHGGGHHEGGHKGHHGEHHGKHHGKHHEGHAGHQEGHAEFHLGFQFKCSAPEKLNKLTIGYFAHFENARSLQVTIATAKGQTQFEVTREQPVIDLSAAM